MDRVNNVREIEDALESANRHSEALENLVSEIRDCENVSPELVDQIGETNKKWTSDMRRYLEAVKKVYNKQSDEE